MKFRKKPVVIEAFTFDELVAHGIASGGNVVNGMPWSFQFKGQPITHENDSCYLIPTLEGTMKMGREDMLIVGVKGELYPCKPDIFAATYEAAEDRGDAAGEAWSNEPPTKQQWYWHWNGDEDSAPLPVSVLYSGTTGKCFVARGQLSLTEAIDCEDYGGYWIPMRPPHVPPRWDSAISHEVCNSKRFYHGWKATCPDCVKQPSRAIPGRAGSEDGVERVAMVLAGIRGGILAEYRGMYWQELDQESRNQYLAEARAALAEMRGGG